MKSTDAFDALNLVRIETMLLAHPVARAYFQGELYDQYDLPFRELILERANGQKITLNEAMLGRLCMIPDGSTVTALKVNECEDNPAGLQIRSSNVFLREGEQSSVIVFRDEAGPAVWVDALHVARHMLGAHAPGRFTTIAFGLMAITAYRLGYRRISLFAAGRGPLVNDDDDALVGYDVWPKLGFDAPVSIVELHRFPHPPLINARTVQDILATAPNWWTKHGSGRTMEFDLSAQSRNWSVLLHYLYTVLHREQP